MIVLGVNADDKGAQLEALVQTVLREQGFEGVRLNVIRAGGNELDIVASQVTPLASTVHRTPLIGEAKAYAGPINMPMWQRFLGKVFLERTSAPQTIGVMIALNGVNGNVFGSYRTLLDHSVRLIVGDDLVEYALGTQEISPEVAVRKAVSQQFQAEPTSLEVAYYGGAYRWVVRWSADSYSIVDGHGQMLSAEVVESLRPALANEVSGELMATEEARAQAERAHDARVRLIGRLLVGETVPATDPEVQETIDSLAEQPYCRIDGDRLVLLAAEELDAHGLAQLIVGLFENTVSVRRLSFMIGGHHEPYLFRLIELLPDVQMGFGLESEEREKLKRIVPPFPSTWVTLATPILMITTHRSDHPDDDNDEIAASDRTAFWEAIAVGARHDFGNPQLRGLLYDHLGVVELEETTSVTYKSKTGVIGEITNTTRDAIGQLDDELAGQANTRHLIIRTVGSAPQPWEHAHPDPIPLD